MCLHSPIAALIEAIWIAMVADQQTSHLPLLPLSPINFLPCSPGDSLKASVSDNPSLKPSVAFYCLRIKSKSHLFSFCYPPTSWLSGSVWEVLPPKGAFWKFQGVVLVVMAIGMRCVNWLLVGGDQKPQTY